ncbi:MAG: hypothetical protein ACLQPD_05970 [Desulfomonilaceae bacterium]
MVSAEENKAIVRRFYDEFFNKGNLQIVNELHTSESEAGVAVRRARVMCGVRS